MRGAAATAEPAELTQGVRLGSHVLRVMPVRGLSVTRFEPDSGVVVLPSSTAPCSRSRATNGASTSHGPVGSTVLEPRRVDQPLVGDRSLIEVGTPSTNPCGAPLAQRASDRSEEHTSELQSLMRISYAVFCLKKKNQQFDAF